MKEKKFNIYLIIFGIVIFVLCISIGGVIGKYVFNKNDDGEINSKEFYCSSDLLTSDNKEYVLNANTVSIDFSIRNYIDDLRINNDDISYSVSCNDGTLSNSSGVMTGGSKNDVSITLSDLENGKSYNVSVTFKSGYSETLSCVFKVLENEESVLFKELEVYDEYVELTLSTTNVNGKLSISYPTYLIPDNTNSIMSDVSIWKVSVSDKVTVNEFYDINSYSSIKLRFFKVNNSDAFSVSDFECKLSSGGTVIIGVEK